jgi:hypothetical protein
MVGTIPLTKYLTESLESGILKAPFNLLDLRNIVMEVDFEDNSTITLTSGRISAVTDRTGRGNNGAEDGTDGPTLVIASDGLQEAVSDGTQWLNFGQTDDLNAIPGTDAFTIIIRAGENTDDDGTFFSKSDADTSLRQYHTFNQGDFGKAVIGGTGVDSSTTANGNSPFTYELSVTTTTATIYKNTTVVDSGPIGTVTNSNDVTMFARITLPSFPLASGIRQAAFVRGVLSAAERKNVAAYFAAKVPTPDAEFLMLGASIMDSAVSDPSLLKTMIDSTYGVNVNVFDEAVSGWTTSDLASNIVSILSNYTDGTGMYCPMHIGGNNVTATRPYSTTTQGEKDTITNDLTTICTAIIAAGHIPIIGELSFRDYDDTTVASPENGSLPYNTNLVHPRAAALTPNWTYNDDTPWLQFYPLILNDHATYLQADNIHLTGAGQQAWRQHIVDTICKKVFTGVPPTQI